MRELLRDEIRHGRLGWAWFACDRVDARVRREIGRGLCAIVGACLRTWQERTALHPSGLGDHGVLPPHAAMGVVEHAVGELVVPGFAYVGIDARGAQAALEAFRGAAPRAVAVL